MGLKIFKSVVIALILRALFAPIERSKWLVYNEPLLLYLPSATFFPPKICTKRRFKLRRLLCFIRAVHFPALEAAVYRLLGGISAAVRSVQDTLRTLPMQPPLASRICCFAIKRHYLGLRLRLRGISVIGKRKNDWYERCQLWISGFFLFFANKRLLYLPVGIIRLPKQGNCEQLCLGRNNN